MASLPAGPILILGLAAVCYVIERLRGGPKRPPRTVPPDDYARRRASAEIAKAVRAELGNTDSIGPPGRIANLKTSFLYLRALRIVEQDATWLDASRSGAWKVAVIAGFRQVELYLARKLGTTTARGPLFGGATDLQPPHLDLARFANSRSTDQSLGFTPTTDAEAVAASNPTKSQVYALAQLDRRRERVIDIVWRAAGIERGVWDTDGTLRDPDLTELLDRRLRSLERLAYQASAGARSDGLGSSSIARTLMVVPGGPNSPIVDDFRVRPFEAPSLPAVLFPALSIPAEIRRESARFEPGAALWYRNRVTREYDLNVWPGTRPGQDHFVAASQPPEVPPRWTLAPDEPDARRGYAWIVTPQGGVGPAQTIEKLFERPSFLDWSARSLLHPEGVLSALHLEALRHALLRRHGTDQRFDALLARYDLALEDPFDVLGHARVPRSIFAPGVTEHFQNEGIPSGELQSGDQIFLEVHPVFFGMWDHDYATALVTAVEPREDGTSDDLGIRVQGFGSADLLLFEFQLLHFERMENLLDVLRDHAVLNQQRLSATGRLPWRAGEAPPFLRAELPPGINSELLLVEWRLFSVETFDAPGAIWIQVLPRSRIWRGRVPDDPREAVALIPKSVAVIRNGDALLVHEAGNAVEVPLDRSLSSLGYSFVEPEQLGHVAVYLPLYEPEGGWPEYFRLKQRNPSRWWPKRLEKVHFEFPMDVARDARDRVRVVRPRLEPPVV